MRAFGFKIQLLLAFGAGVVLLAIVGVLSDRTILREEVDQEWVEHTHLVLEKLAGVRTDLIDQESGQRGYALTGDRAFLDSYERGRARLQEDCAELRRLTSDNASQQGALDRLNALIADRLALYQEQGAEGASMRIREKAGEQLKERIAALLEPAVPLSHRSPKRRGGARAIEASSRRVPEMRPPLVGLSPLLRPALAVRAARDSPSLRSLPP
jgi:CHASE3 domain sensor protein